MTYTIKQIENGNFQLVVVRRGVNIEISAHKTETQAKALLKDEYPTAKAS